MCEKCNGTGVIREEVKEFDRGKFRELFDNLIESAEAARKIYDEAPSDQKAMMILGGFYAKIIPHMENNLETLMEFAIEALANDPKMQERFIQAALKLFGRDN